MTTTRESDMTVDPAARAEIANHAKAEACLSLHATESGAGIHLFTSSLAPAQPARFLAWKTAQSAFVNRSLALAGALNSALLHDGFNVTLSRTALIAVDNMTCPALAIEIAPARGPDGKVTAEPDDADYQARVAATLAAAAPRVAHGASPAMIPRYQKIVFSVLLAAALIMAGVLWHLRQRAHQRLLAGEDSAPTKAPEVAPTERATLLVANDADGSMLVQARSLPFRPTPAPAPACSWASYLTSMLHPMRRIL